MINLIGLTDTAQAGIVSVMTTYAPVEPKDHDAQCQRGQDAAHYALDREHCERCRELATRIGA
jgi:hypothetical protein